MDLSHITELLAAVAEIIEAIVHLHEAQAILIATIGWVLGVRRKRKKKY